MDWVEDTRQAYRLLEEAADLLERAGVEEYATAIDELRRELEMDFLGGRASVG
jgi:hypothetical protein